ncbi:MAG TPA: hypothetical protein PKD37_04520 [Oligoflexia bacterium]|nr:hypothetical protein [Oligoflexia bacterium]HMP27230.1 hypothetical protein [Oligoflexia bacterium]
MEYITNAPIQAGNIKKESTDKLLPIAVALTINQIIERTSEVGISWNLVRANSDNPEIELALAENELRNFNLESNQVPKISRYLDTDQGFSAWTQKQLLKSLELGAITISNEKVIECGACESPTALHGVKFLPSICSYCKSEGDFRTSIRRVITGLLPKSDEQLAECVDITKVPPNWKGQIAMLPDRILISKKRKAGISLDKFDLDNLQLDPKVSNAALIMYGGTIKKADKSWGVVGIKNLGKIAPFSYIFRGAESRPGYVTISKMPLNELVHSDSDEIRLPRPALTTLLTCLSLDCQTWADNQSRLNEIKKYARRIFALISNSSLLRHLGNSIKAKTALELTKILPALVKEKKLFGKYL